MFEQYVLSLKSRHTRDAYRRDLTKFSQWLADQGVAVTDLSPKVLLQYRSHLMEQYEAATVNRHLSALRGYAQWLALNEVVSPAVYQAAQTLRGVEASTKLPRLLTEQDLENLLCQPDPLTVDGLCDLVFLRLLLSSGIRLDEAVRLDIEDLDLSTRSAIVRGKRDKERKVFFDSPTEQTIRAYLLVRRPTPTSVSPACLNTNPRSSWWRPR